jgi:hypothetical protein
MFNGGPEGLAKTWPPKHRDTIRHKPECLRLPPLVLALPGLEVAQGALGCRLGLVPDRF